MNEYRDTPHDVTYDPDTGMHTCSACGDSSNQPPPIPCLANARYRAAQEDAREIVTLMKMAEEQGLDDDANIRGIVRECMSTYAEPRQAVLLVEVLARGVADTFEDLAEWSAHVVTALSADEEDQ